MMAGQPSRLGPQLQTGPGSDVPLTAGRASVLPLHLSKVQSLGAVAPAFVAQSPLWAAISEGLDGSAL